MIIVIPFSDLFFVFVLVGNNLVVTLHRINK